MIKIDDGDFFLVEPSEKYLEQIAEYKQAFLNADSSMDGCGPLRTSDNFSNNLHAILCYIEHI